MTQGRRANDRLDVLIEKLGLTEYESIETVSFYETLIDANKGKGILHKLYDGQVVSAARLSEMVQALMEYMDVTIVEEPTPRLKVVKRKSTKKTESTYKRKYVKSGKYSKKNKNV